VLLLFLEPEKQQGGQIVDTLFSTKPDRGSFVADTDLLPSGRDELNLAEFPMAVLGDRAPVGVKSLVFEDEIRDQGTGEIVTRRLTVSPSEQFGLPTALDEDVIVGLIQLTRRNNNFTNRSVPFTRYALLQILGWPDKGGSYDRLEESLKRWLGVTLFYERAWWDKDEKSWVDEHFHLIDNVTLYDAEARKRKKKNNPDAALPLSSFTWNQVIFRSFQAENLKKLDLEAYFGLNFAPARRMYRFLDKRFYRRNRWQFDLREFACEHVGFARSYDNAQLRRKMLPSIQELETIGFLEPLPEDERFIQVRRGVWRVMFLKKLEAPTGGDRAVKSLTGGVERDLIERGVTASVAAELITSHPVERIRVKLEVFDWLTENKDSRVSKNPAGYLVKSIRDDFAPPKGFEPKAARDAKKQAAEETKRRRRDAEVKREQDDKARHEAEIAPLEAYWQALSPSAQAKFFDEALAQAEHWLREQAAKSGVMAEAAKKQIIYTHIRRTLDPKRSA